MTDTRYPAYWNEAAQRWCDEDGKFIQFVCRECGETLSAYVEDDRGEWPRADEDDHCELCAIMTRGIAVTHDNVERDLAEERLLQIPPPSAFTKFDWAVSEAEAAVTGLALAREEFQAAVERGVDQDALMLPAELDRLSSDIDNAIGLLAKATSAVDQVTFLLPRSANRTPFDRFGWRHSVLALASQPPGRTGRDCHPDRVLKAASHGWEKYP
jgi:hypothetical protein